MKTNLKGLILLLIVTSILTACNQTAPSGGITISKQYSPEEFTYLWNRANTLKNIDSLAMLYDDTVLFYGIKLSREKCIAAKSKFLKQHPDFKQDIAKYLNSEKSPNNTTRCIFIKKATLNNTVKEYYSYLIIRKTDAGWKIRTEGDATTDKNIEVLTHTNPGDIPADAMSGDYNGDGKKEYAWVVSPETDSVNFSECIGDCDCFIKFSDPTIPFIKIKSCIGGSLVNHGDLNSDGTDEVGLLPEWFTSCWRDYLVYTLRDGKWIYTVDPIATHCEQWLAGAKPIERDPKRKGYAIIRYSDMDSDFRVLTKSVPFN